VPEQAVSAAAPMTRAVPMAATLRVDVCMWCVLSIENRLPVSEPHEIDFVKERNWGKLNHRLTRPLRDGIDFRNRG
jgi:hypothetical protein